MRRFEDRSGLAWDVVLGRESWGTLLALFVPAGHDSPPRQAALRAVSLEAAQQELDAMPTSELGGLFARSTVKEN